MRKNEWIFQSYIFSPLDLCRAKEVNFYNLQVIICQKQAFFRYFLAIYTRKSVSKLCKSKLANSRTHHFPESKLNVIDNFDAWIPNLAISRSRNGQFFPKLQKEILIFRRKIQILSCFDLTEFFHHFYKVRKNVLREKNCQIEIVKFSNF